MKVVYLAWLRNRTGCASEQIDGDFADLAALLAHLRARHPSLAEPIDQGVVRCAVNQEFAEPERALTSSDEVALFPPITGG